MGVANGRHGSVLRGQWQGATECGMTALCRHFAHRVARSGDGVRPLTHPLWRWRGPCDVEAEPEAQDHDRLAVLQHMAHEASVGMERVCAVHSVPL